jgi:xanthine dehydrogenase accessory factor
MHDSFLEKALALNQNAEPYATAVIVRRRIPSSGKPGDKAIITADGNIYGWIGGGCTRGIVLKEALASLRDHKPRIVNISPESLGSSFEDTKNYTMTCQSGGEVEVYIEPVIPKPQLLIFGKSHIAMALARIAKAMDYRVHVIMSVVEDDVFPTADKVMSIGEFEGNETYKHSHVVVCTQGEGDAEALLKALSLGSSYVSFVASRKKANAIYQEVRLKGATMDQLKVIRTPAGIDIGAKLPEEVAISILAEIIQTFRAQQAEQKEATVSELPNDDYYLNPVCNIPVQKSTAKHVLVYDNQKVYFCCDGCKVSFEKDPEKYMAKVGQE